MKNPGWLLYGAASPLCWMMWCLTHLDLLSCHPGGVVAVMWSCVGLTDLAGIV
jgi:hypothetical protein